jgi:hypothetical protein
MAAEEDQHLDYVVHETGHSLQLNHSRTVSESPTNNSDYGDRYDVMSCRPCYSTSEGSYQGRGGPGLNAVQLAMAGWLPPARVLTFNPDTCTQRSVPMAALNHPEAAGSLQARIPAAVPLVKKFTSTTSDYYSIELRSTSGWDRNIPEDTFLVHLKGQDNYSYWVDAAGALTAGREFVDAAHRAYVVVNSIAATPASTGVVTLGSCKIHTRLANAGATRGAYHDVVTLSADLTVDPGGAPVPNAPTRLSIGSQTCAATTDTAGRASCRVRLEQTPGTYQVTASFAGTQALDARTATTAFVIDRQATAVRYDGPVTLTNGSASSLRATLTEASGTPVANRGVSFTVGTGAAAQTCGGTTDGDGVAGCTIPRVLQVGGASSVRVAFDGDGHYLPSGTTAPVSVVKGRTTLRYEGPANVANDFPATFSAVLSQQDGAVALPDRTVRVRLGTGSAVQTCTGTTDGAGRMRCTIATVAQPATATGAAVQVDFAGDDYFLPSTGAATVKLLYYTGRAYALASRLAVLPPTVVSDTGTVTTASRSSVERNAVTISNPVVSASSLGATVTTGDGRSTGQAAAENVTIGIAGLPVIRVAAVRAVSSSTCGVGGFTAGTSAGVTIESLTIGGVVQNTAAVAPNTVLRLGVATITLNEQRPDPQTSAGTLVNALHVSVPGVADVVVSAAASGVLNCP